ncbi:MAG: NAD(P)-dependent oxidoreductase, partial [Parasporobacterium sp.]|nr:NAD(P)-dependent oxidoreductase [Parasporobacterium sp.]
IYDMINVIPGLLSEEKYAFVTGACPEIKEAYALQDNGFYKCMETDPDKREALKAMFRSTGFTALNFTDSRGIFQYYDLSWLYGDISKALDKGIKVLNISTEPVSIAEIYAACYGGEFVNEVAAKPPVYAFRTEHFAALGGFKAADDPGRYLYSKEETLASIKTFVEVSK